MNDTILFTVVGISMGVYFYLLVAEAIYNRCKRKRVEMLLLRSVSALSNLSRQHEGFQHGMGRCECEAHRSARLCVRAYHELGDANG